MDKYPSVERLFDLINSLKIPEAQRSQLIKEISELLEYYNSVLSSASSTLESVINDKLDSQKKEVLWSSQYQVQ